MITAKKSDSAFSDGLTMNQYHALEGIVGEHGLVQVLAELQQIVSKNTGVSVLLHATIKPKEKGRD